MTKHEPWCGQPSWKAVAHGATNEKRVEILQSGHYGVVGGAEGLFCRDDCARLAQEELDKT